MNGASQRHLVFEVERVRTERKRLAAISVHCGECRYLTDFVELADLASLFEVSVADAVLQLRRRKVHMSHVGGGSIVVCSESLLRRSDPDHAILSKSLPPAASDDAYL